MPIEHEGATVAVLSVSSATARAERWRHAVARRPCAGYRRDPARQPGGLGRMKSPDSTWRSSMLGTSSRARRRGERCGPAGSPARHPHAVRGTGLALAARSPYAVDPRRGPARGRVRARHQYVPLPVLRRRRRHLHVPGLGGAAPGRTGTLHLLVRPCPARLDPDRRMDAGERWDACLRAYRGVRPGVHARAAAGLHRAPLHGRLPASRAESRSRRSPRCSLRSPPTGCTFTAGCCWTTSAPSGCWPAWCCCSRRSSR